MTTTGATIIEPIYDRELKFHSGISQINTERKWGYIGIDGKILVEPEYDYATPVENGFAVVRRGYDAPKFHILDVKNGRILKELPYQLVGGFHEGLAKAKIDGKWGYTDTDGELVIPARFATAEDATDFCCGHAFVKVDGLWGLINTDGDTVVEPKYSKIGETRNGLAIVYSGNIFSGGEYRISQPQRRWPPHSRHDIRQDKF